MKRSVAMGVAVALGFASACMPVGPSAAAAEPPVRLPDVDPKAMTPEQKQLLNYAYLALRPDLLAALKPTGDQRIVVRYARMKINYIVTLDRTPKGEAVVSGGRGGGGGMVKFILQSLTHVHAALSDSQRQAFEKLVADQKLQQITVDSWGAWFLLRYTFGPDDPVEKVRTSDGRTLDVVVPEDEDIKQWWTELTAADEVVRALNHELWEIRSCAGEWLIRRGSASFDAPTKKQIAETIINWVEKGEVANTGWWMHAYSQLAQADHEQRVLALLEKSDLHQLSGIVAAYAAIAPTKAIDHIAKPGRDPQYKMRAIQGLGMAPDGLRLLQAVRPKMPDMKWMIDQQVKSVTELQKARAEGRPENPGEAAAIENRKKAQREAEERAKSGKNPSDYQGFDDWFADLSSDDRRKMDKAAHHFTHSVHAVDLSKATPQQRAAVFKIAHASLIAPKTVINRDASGRLVIASAAPENTDLLVELIKPENGRFHYPLAALIRVNPERASEVLLSMEDQKFSIGKLREATLLVPADALPVLEKTQPKLKSKITVETYGKFIDELKKTQAGS